MMVADTAKESATTLTVRIASTEMHANFATFAPGDEYPKRNDTKKIGRTRDSWLNDQPRRPMKIMSVSYVA